MKTDIAQKVTHASIQIAADLYGHLFKATSVSAMNRLSMRIPIAQVENSNAVA